MIAVVSALSVTAVKGTRLRRVDEIDVDGYGARSDRRFFIVDARDRMVNGKPLGELNTVIADYDDSARTLALTFADGRVVEGVVTPGAEIATRFYSGTLHGRLIDGPWSAALSQCVGRQVRLVEPLRGNAVDRGARGAITLISRASLERLRAEAGVSELDPRRFRMLIELDGPEAHAEDDWVGRRLSVGEAQIEINGHVGRCLITSREPETGVIDLPTLDVIRGYRPDVRTTEPLPFGVYGGVITPGRIHVGASADLR